MVEETGVPPPNPKSLARFSHALYGMGEGDIKTSYYEDGSRIIYHWNPI